MSAAIERDAIQFASPATALIDRVLGQLHPRLLSQGSALVSEVSLDLGLEQQSRSILREAVSRAVGVPLEVGAAFGTESELRAHADTAALQKVDPAEPLLAGEALFDVALEIFVQDLVAATAASVTHLARVLHVSIWRRFPVGALAYVDALVQQLALAKQQGRRDFAQHLHDRTSNDLAAVIQRIDLSLSESSKSDAYILESRSILVQVVQELRTLMVDVREAANHVPFADSMRLLLESRPSTLRMTLSEEGSTRPLQQEVHEAIVAVTAEALRNCERHALHASKVHVAIRWRSNSIKISVHDDGTKRAWSSPGVGLHTMRERVERLRGQLVVDRAKLGTIVTVIVPIASTGDEGLQE